MGLTTIFLLCVLLLDKTAFSKADLLNNAKDIKSEGEIKEFSKAILQRVLEEFKILREEVAAMRDTQHLIQTELVELKEKLNVSLKRKKEMEQENLKLRLENEILINQTENITLHKKKVQTNARGVLR